MFCTSCATQLPEDAKACSKCGKLTGAVAPAQTAKPKVGAGLSSGLIASFINTDVRLNPAVVKIIYLLGLIVIAANTTLSVIYAISTMVGTSVMGVRVGGSVGDGFLQLLSAVAINAIFVLVLRVLCEAVLLLNVNKKG